MCRKRSIFFNFYLQSAWLLVALYCLPFVSVSQTPGGNATNLTFWYKGDAGTSTTTNGSVITTWSDQTANGINATEITTGPSYQNPLINYNPGVDFSLASGGFAVPDNNSINTSSSTAKSYSIMFRTGSDVLTQQMIYEQGGGGTGLNLYIDGGFLIANLWVSSVESSGSTSIAANEDYVFTYTFDGANTRIDAYLNGTQVLTNITAPATLGSHGGDPGMGYVNGNTQYVGDIGTSNNEPFGGAVAEMAYYHADVFTTTEKDQVESYLCLKYGVSKAADYIASDGTTTFWSNSTNTGYTNNIAGIGRDDDSDLNQKQSISESSDGLVSIGLGTVATDNASNTNTFSSDKSFMMWGNNGGSLIFTNTGAPTGSIILSRQWKVEETSTVGTVKISIPASTSSATNKIPEAQDLKLLVDADGDFTSGSSSSSMLLIGDNWETTVDLVDGEFFTVAVEGATLTATTNGDESGPVDLLYTVTLPSINSTGSTITFDIADAGTGTASSGTDYTAISGGSQISVLNGQQTGTFPVAVLDDAIPESDETVTLTISNPSNVLVSIGVANATASITDNDVSSPGGVTSNLIFWLKANAGTNTTVDGTTVNSWLDETSNNNDASEVTTGPTYVETFENEQPALNFTANTGGLTMADDADINTGGSNFSAKSYSVSFTTGSDVTTRQVIYEQGGTGTGMNLYIESGSLFANLYTGNTDHASSTSVSANTSYIVSFIYDGANTRWDMYLNGTSVANATGLGTTFGTHSGDIGIGVIDNNTQFNGGVDVSTGESFLGYFKEIVYYSDIVLNTSQLNSLESYLAVKYATSLQSDYLASDGTTVYWNATTNTGYLNHVTVIGLDEETSIDIKQAKSTASGSLITIGLGSVESSNSANTNSFTADKSFLAWGDDNGSLTFSTTGAPAGSQLLQRSWRIDETATVGTVQVQVPDNSSSETTTLPAVSSLNLLRDDDGDFSSGATAIPMTLNGANWEADIDFTDGEYFSFSIGGANLSVTTNGDETGPVDIVYTVTLLSTNSSGSAITFDITDDGTGTAISGLDYNAFSGSAQITINNGAISGDFTVTVNDDSFEEGPETLNATISNPSDLSVSIGTATAEATIADDDSSIPGGISSGLVFWLKADQGVTTATQGATVTAMIDQTLNGHDASEVSPGPTYDAVLTNFNPAIDFSSATGGLTIANDPDINSADNTEKSYTIVFRTGTDVTSRQLLYEEGGATNGMNVYIESSNLIGNIWNNSVDNAASTAIIASTDYIFTFVYDGANSRWDGYLNGSLAMTDATSPTSLLSHTGAVGIGVISADTQYDGGIDITSGEGFNGQIMEMIYYNNVAFSTADRTRVESSVAAKYGITYANNYIASDGTTVFWNPTTNSTYQNDVAVLARDGTSGLEQKQSSSVSVDAVVSIGLSTVEASNSDNTGVFNSNTEFLAWGNDNGSLSGESSNSGLSPQTGAADQLQRTWLIEETGTVPTVQVAFPKTDVDSYFSLLSFGGLNLRVADDDALTTNIQDVSLTETTIDGIIYYTADFDFSGTQYFSIVQTGFILWDGSEWRGGLSTTTNHGPSDESGDASKILYIQSGSTAAVNEGVAVTDVEISSSATLQMDPSSCLIVTGSIINSGTLTFEADATGFSQYNGPAINASFEQYIDTEGWHNIGSPFSDVNFNDFSFLNDNGQLNHPLEGTSLDTCNYCNVWYYDPSTDIGTDIGFGSTNAFGTWRSSIDGTEDFKADKGWNLYLDESFNFGSSPWTISLSGVFNAGNKNQIVNENNGGWNLVANPYPCNLDWETVDDDIASSGIAVGYHVWDEANTNYATYSGGVGTLGATQYIPPFQGFYIQTSTAGAQSSGDVFRSFALTDADRTTTCQSSNFFKTTDTPDLLVIRTENLSSAKIDETILKFDDNALMSFSSNEDVRKLLTPYKDVAAVYSKTDGEKLSINSLVYPLNEDNILLGTVCQNGSENKIGLAKKPEGWIVYLEDLKTGNWHNLSESNYRFTQDNSFQERFLLHYSLTDIDVDFSSELPFSAFINQGQLIIEAEKSMLNNNWQLNSIEGALINKGNLSITVKEQMAIDIDNLRSGIYLLSVEYNGRLYTQKIPVVRQ